MKSLILSLLLSAGLTPLFAIAASESKAAPKDTVPVVSASADDALEMAELEPARDALSEQETAAWRAHNQNPAASKESAKKSAESASDKD